MANWGKFRESDNSKWERKTQTVFMYGIAKNGLYVWNKRAGRTDQNSRQKPRFSFSAIRNIFPHKLASLHHIPPVAAAIIIYMSKCVSCLELIIRTRFIDEYTVWLYRDSRGLIFSYGIRKYSDH